MMDAPKDWTWGSEFTNLETHFLLYDRASPGFTCIWRFGNGDCRDLRIMMHTPDCTLVGEYLWEVTGSIFTSLETYWRGSGSLASKLHDIRLKLSMNHDIHQFA